MGPTKPCLLVKKPKFAVFDRASCNKGFFENVCTPAQLAVSPFAPGNVAPLLVLHIDLSMKRRCSKNRRANNIKNHNNKKTAHTLRAAKPYPKQHRHGQGQGVTHLTHTAY